MGFRVSLLIVAVLAGCAAQPPAAPVAATTGLPAVEVLSLDRQPTSLPVLTRGKPALIALWATWCESCERELGALDRLQRRVGRQALVVGVAVGEPLEDVRDFVRSRSLGYPQVVDESFHLADALGSDRVPTTLVVDRRGVVRHAGGALDAQALEALRAAMRE